MFITMDCRQNWMRGKELEQKQKTQISQKDVLHWKIVTCSSNICRLKYNSEFLSLNVQYSNHFWTNVVGKLTKNVRQFFCKQQSLNQKIRRTLGIEWVSEVRTDLTVRTMKSRNTCIIIQWIYREWWMFLFKTVD